MNIFYTSRTTDHCAKDHCDVHLRKMIVEYAQLLSTAHHLNGDTEYAKQLYKATHINHPCAKWVRQSKEHYAYLYYLFMSCCREYTSRTGKHHATWTRYGDLLFAMPMGIDDDSWIDPPQCMPDEYKQESTIEAYKAYLNAKYKEWKSRVLTEGKRPVKVSWTNREVPEWVID